MRIVAALVLLMAGTSSSALADTVKLQTGNWTDSKTLTWVGRLDHIDPKSGVAYFAYKCHGSQIAYKVHITRILSLTIDGWIDDPNTFPNTRESLDSPLSSNVNVRRSIKIAHADQYMLPLMSSLLVTPDRTSDPIYLHGEILSVAPDKIVLWALDTSGNHQTVTIDRQYFKQWVR